MKVLEIVIIITSVLILWVLALLFVGSFDLSDEFLIIGNYGKKKSFLRRLFDGIKIMWSL